MEDEREVEFTAAMLEIYKRAKDECGYNAKVYLAMVTELGALETARRLLHASTVSDGYTTLWEARRLDLTVEAVALQPEWSDLFTDEEKTIARRRLEEYGYLDGESAR